MSTSELIDLDENRLCRAAYDADIAQGLGWYDGLTSQRRSHGVHLPRRGQECDLPEIAVAIKDKIILKAMTPEPGNRLQQAYFGFKTEFRFEPYISQAKNKNLCREVAMFRVGAHWLHVCRGRYMGLEYPHRICPTCTGAVDNQNHAVFHCQEYNAERIKFADLFMGQCRQNLRAVLVHNPCHQLALFLIACKSARLERRAITANVTQCESMLTAVRYDGEPDIDLAHEYRITELDTYDSE